jgi:hypothetical protein
VASCSQFRADDDMAMALLMRCCLSRCHVQSLPTIFHSKGQLLECFYSCFSHQPTTRYARYHSLLPLTHRIGRTRGLSTRASRLHLYLLSHRMCPFRLSLVSSCSPSIGARLNNSNFNLHVTSLIPPPTFPHPDDPYLIFHRVSCTRIYTQLRLLACCQAICKRAAAE